MRITPSMLGKSALALAIAAIISPVAAGQSSKPTLLNQVTVTATRTARELQDVASSVAIISEEEIEQDLVTDIADLVRYEPGINVTNDSRTGSGSFNIRGMDGNRVRITVDGVDQPKAFDSTKMFLRSQRNYIDVDTLKSVEIVKGPASTIHGSDAVGGVVAFRTKDPADYLPAPGDSSYAAIKAGYASVDHGFNETLSFANRTGQLESMLIYTRRDAHQRETYGGSDIDGDARTQSNPQQAGSNSLLGKLQYQLSDNQRIGFTAEWFDAEMDTDIRSLKGSQTSGNDSAYSRFDADDTTRRSRIGLTHDWDTNFAAFDTMQWSLNWQDSETNQVTRDAMLVDINSSPLVQDLQTQERLKDYAYAETSWQLDLNLSKSLDFHRHSHLFSYGLSYQRREHENLNITHYLANPDNKPNPDITRYAPLMTVNHVGFYLQDEISLLADRLLIGPGIRYDRFEPNTRSDAIYTGQINDEMHDNWSFKLGTVYEFTDSVSGFAQFSQGFSTPDLFAMYFEENRPNGAPVHIMPNPNLTPETSDSFEVGLRTNNQLGSAEVTAFYNTYEDFIERKDTFLLPPVNGVLFQAQYQNLDEATIKGVEFKSMLWLDKAINAPDGSRLHMAAAWSQGEGGKPGSEEPLNSIAPLTAVIGLGYDAPAGNWGSDLHWTLVAGKDEGDISQGDTVAGDMNENGSGEQFASPGYGLLDLTAYYQPQENITINAGIFNITDKKYWAWDDVRGLSNDYVGLDRYTQPGRNYSVSIKWEI